MSLPEMTTIVVLCHTMRGRQFKAFYRGTVCRFMTSEFPRRLFSYPLRGPDMEETDAVGNCKRYGKGID